MKRMRRSFFIVFVIAILAATLLWGTGCSGNGSLSDEKIDASARLSNENATAEASALYDYIISNYKTKIISGQQESTWISEDYEFDYIYETTGKYPAIRGFDFIDDDFDGVVERAKKWDARGGIVTICWHCSANFDGGYDECKRDSLTNAQWDAMFTEGTPEHAAAISGMDKAGNALLELQKEGIPVLWRPFHKFDGWWFGWSKGTKKAEHFKKLWKMMYDHFTDELHLNNLIWVLGYSYVGISIPKFYPGDEYCDIVGSDSYRVSIFGAEKGTYKKLLDVVQNKKPIVFHETGLIPTVKQFKDVPWGWFMTWHTTYLTDKNKKENLSALYNDPYVITLDDLPNRQLAVN